MRTRAAVLRGPQAPFVMEDVDLGEPGPGEVLVRIAGAGMCHTDLAVRAGGSAGQGLPAILGHEGAGVVEQVGAGVTRVRPGDHVVLSYDSCGTCRQCLAGEPSYCAEFRSRNLEAARSAVAADGSPLASRWFGQSSFAAHAIGTERNVVPVDRELPLELLGPLGCGVQTGAGSILLGLGVTAGTSVAVFGAGGVGLSAVMAAVLAGASPIVVVDLHHKRRELALELGATHAFDGADPELAEQITAATDGVDQALDTTGVPAVIRTAVETLTPRGRCGMVGVSTAPLELAPSVLAGRMLTFLLEGDAVPQLFIPQLITHWQHGRFPFDRLIRTYRLDAINDAEQDCHSGDTIKPVLIP